MTLGSAAFGTVIGSVISQVMHNFNGQMGYTAAELQAEGTRKMRRALQAVSLPQVVV